MDWWANTTSHLLLVRLSRGADGTIILSTGSTVRSRTLVSLSLSSLTVPLVVLLVMAAGVSFFSASLLSCPSFSRSSCCSSSCCCCSCVSFPMWAKRDYKANSNHGSSSIVPRTISLKISLGIILATMVRSNRVRDDSQNRHTEDGATDIEEHLHHKHKHIYTRKGWETHIVNTRSSPLMLFLCSSDDRHVANEIYSSDTSDV